LLNEVDCCASGRDERSNKRENRKINRLPSGQAYCIWQDNE